MSVQVLPCFLKATVSFGLESPTESLDSIYFPSAVLCNMNALSGSFIRDISEDPGKACASCFTYCLIYFILGTDLAQWEFTDVFRYQF